MDIPIRRVGNSLGVIVPKRVLEHWGLAEGSVVSLTADGITFGGQSAAVSAEAIWQDKRRRQARDHATTEPMRRSFFTAEIARGALIDGSPL